MHAGSTWGSTLGSRRGTATALLAVAAAVALTATGCGSSGSASASGQKTITLITGVKSDPLDRKSVV